MTENIKSISWARVLKLIQDAKKQTISVYELTEQLGLEKGSLALEKTIQILIRQGKIKVAIGKSASGLVCRLAYIAKESEPGKREKVFQDKAEE